MGGGEGGGGREWHGYQKRREMEKKESEPLIPAHLTVPLTVPPSHSANVSPPISPSKRRSGGTGRGVGLLMLPCPLRELLDSGGHGRGLLAEAIADPGRNSEFSALKEGGGGVLKPGWAAPPPRGPNRCRGRPSAHAVNADIDPHAHRNIAYTLTNTGTINKDPE